MRLLTVLSTVLLLSALANVAFGENDGSRTIQKGRWSIAISIPDGGGNTLGIWRMVSGHSNLGVDIGATHLSQEPGTNTQSDISLRPSIKRYLFLHRSAAPFVLGTLTGEYGWTNSRGYKSYNRRASAALGLGVDWTPIEAMSIGAYTGLNLSYYSRSDEFQRYRVWSFGTLASALTMSLYF